MDDLFKDLENLGIKDLDSMDLYKKVDNGKNTKPLSKEATNAILYLRKTVCPVCDRHFNTPTVRVGRVRFVNSDLDLRPRYSGFDPILYDVVACPTCGYAALNKFFQKVSDTKIKLVREKISMQYRGKEYPEVFDYKVAIERYKLAIVCGAVGNDRTGIKAYLCLKTAWLYRGYREMVIEDESLCHELKQYELSFLKRALDGFLIAFEQEAFPIMGIDQGTMLYLIAELYRRTGDIKASRLWLSRVLKKPGTSKRLQDKIFEVKKRLHDEDIT